MCVGSQKILNTKYIYCSVHLEKYLRKYYWEIILIFMVTNNSICIKYSIVQPTQMLNFHSMFCSSA